MKKRTIIVSIILLIVVTASIIFIWTRPLSLTMEQIFPSQALMYVRLSHVAVDLDQFLQSPVWKGISVIDVPKVLEHNHVSAKDIQSFKNMQKEIELFISSPLTKKFLGTEIAAGFYEQDSSKVQDPLKSYDFLFASRLGLSLQMAELFVSMANQWSDDVTTTTELYNDFKIVHVHFRKRKLDLQYTRLHDVLLVANSPSNILHQTLDVYNKKRPSLATDDDFSKSFKQAYSKGHGVFYINLKSFLDRFTKDVPQRQRKNYEQVSEMISGFKSSTISFLPGDTTKMKIIMHFEPERLNPYWHALFSCPGSMNDSLKIVPHNLIAYSWGQCYDFKELWSNAKASLLSSEKTKDGLEKWKHRLEKRFKLDINKDILPILGTQLGWYLNDIDIQGLFPYPRAVVFLKVENRSMADSLMERLSKTPFGLLQQEEYQRSTVHFMSLPLGANIDPGYVFLGDYLLLGSSRQLLKTSIDAFNNSNQSLQSNDTLKQFNINDKEVDQGMSFIKIGDVSSGLEQLLNWYNKMLASQITSSLAYQQEVQSRQKELDESLASKEEELKLAQKNLKNIQSKMNATDISDEEKTNQQDNMDHLTSDIKILKEDVDSYHKQKKELHQTFAAYQKRAESAKAWLFNSDELIMPFLKAFEGLNALGMKWYLKDQTSNTEIFIK